MVRYFDRSSVRDGFQLSYCKEHEYRVVAGSRDGAYHDNQRAGPRAQLLVLIQVPVRLDALKFTIEPNGTTSSAALLRVKRSSVGLPFEFTGLTRSTLHVLQLEHDLEDLGDNLGG